MSEHIILSSGGMDSFFLAEQYRHLDHVFVDIGHKYRSKELESAQRLAAFFGVRLHHMQGAQIGGREHETGIIPLRNAELILNAGQLADHIYLGVLEGEINSDKSPEFFRSMETMMTISCRPQYWSAGREFLIHTPLANSSKAELVKGIMEQLDVDLVLAMLKTVSCYDAGDEHCGKCASCFKRWVALTVGMKMDRGEADFLVHPADQQPLQFWREKGYAGKRIREIELAYLIAKRV